MSPAGSGIPYHEIVAVVDRLLDESDEDVSRLAGLLDALTPSVRDELLVSDLLNAYQVFYFFFRVEPEELIRERLELEPASALVRGLHIQEIELLELHFSVKDRTARIEISDGDRTLAVFTGKNAYADGVRFIDDGFNG